MARGKFAKNVRGSVQTAGEFDSNPISFPCDARSLGFNGAGSPHSDEPVSFLLCPGAFYSFHLPHWVLRHIERRKVVFQWKCGLKLPPYPKAVSIGFRVICDCSDYITASRFQSGWAENWIWPVSLKYPFSPSVLVQYNTRQLFKDTHHSRII